MQCLAVLLREEAGTLRCLGRRAECICKRVVEQRFCLVFLSLYIFSIFLKNYFQDVNKEIKSFLSEIGFILIRNIQLFRVCTCEQLVIYMLWGTLCEIFPVHSSTLAVNT